MLVICQLAFVVRFRLFEQVREEGGVESVYSRLEITFILFEVRSRKSLTSFEEQLFDF